MKRLIDYLNIAGKHLSILDTVFRTNHPPYAAMSMKLESLPLYDELRKEIYAGGKKGGTYSLGRQMILGDLLQYIFTGRGYYFAVRGDPQREAFIKMIMYVSNILILMDNSSVDVQLRNRMLVELRRGIGSAFFENEEQKNLYRELRNYKGFILPDEGTEHDDTLDSMLPKRVGAIPELLVYTYLIRKNYGYVIPLFHSQRLLGKPYSNIKFIVPPDLLLLRSKGEIFGIEVGGGKEQQIGSFTTITSIPVFTATIGHPRQTQPYRCGKCLKWISYCDEVIRLCSINQEPDAEYVDCNECSFFNGLDDALKNCPDVVYHGRANDHYGNIRELRYHYDCVSGDPEITKVLQRARTPKLIAPLPWVSGLDFLTEEV